MKSVELTNEQFKTIPGYTTKITPPRWKDKVDDLFYKLKELDNVSLKRKAWLTEEDGSEILLLELEVQIGNIQKRVQFQLEPILIQVKKRKGSRYGPIEIVTMENASWKLFHDLLERKLAAVRLGVVEIHHELMSYISKQLPDGTMGTFADFMDRILQEQRGLEGLQLEDKREIKAVDAEVVPR